MSKLDQRERRAVSKPEVPLEPPGTRTPASSDDQASSREGSIRERETAQRERALTAREEAVLAREETARLREAAIGAEQEAIRARTSLEQVMNQLRDVNEQLVIATVRAQTMTEEAERANHLKDEFLATVSHELRTPLNAVLGWARMLKAERVHATRVPHAIDAVERNASMLTRIIDDLLDVSRIMAGTLHLTHQPVNLTEVTEAAVESLRMLAEVKSIRINVASDPSAIEPVSGDASRLQQVISNLVSNAIKFTPEGGRIDVSLKQSRHDIELAVADTGQGIDPAFLPHVFEPFRQAAGATARRHAGLGLGLAIVRQIVQLHGGTVRAESGGPGQGAIFTVYLPMLPAAAGPDRRSPETSGTALQRLDALHVLVVEDHPDSRELMSTVLEHAGARVTTCSSVSEALEILETVQPDVLVSDIGLPGEDGYGLIRTIRRQESEHGGFLPAIALTGFTRAEDRTRVLAAGFQAHLSKPFDAVELTAAISTLTLRQRHRRA